MNLDLVGGGLPSGRWRRTRARVENLGQKHTNASLKVTVKVKVRERLIPDLVSLLFLSSQNSEICSDEKQRIKAKCDEVAALIPNTNLFLPALA